MSARKKRDFGRIETPRAELEFVVRNVKFYTRSLGATDQFQNRFVWFAPNCWTHDMADGVFSDITAAVADRFDMWEELGLAYLDKFKTPEQLEKVSVLENEIFEAMKFHGLEPKLRHA